MTQEEFELNLLILGFEPITNGWLLKSDTTIIVETYKKEELLLWIRGGITNHYYNTHQSRENIINVIGGTKT